jgi:hypothetical protein
METIPWYAWIAIAGVVVWGLVAILGGFGFGRGKRDTALAEAMRDNAATNKALLEKLDGIDSRLGAVEKTLNDIP